MMLSQALLSAAAAGVGCGSGCGSAASAFLATYILSEGRRLRDSFLQVAVFYFGKMLAILSVCISGAAIGKVLVNDSGIFSGIPLGKLVSAVILLAGLWLLLDWVKERRGCSGCHHCPSTSRIMPTFSVGLAYGFSPCAPLMMVLGYSVLLSVPEALILGIVFSLASSLIPALLTLTIAGVLSANISAQLGQYLPWFRLTVYIFYLIAGITGVLFL